MNLLLQLILVIMSFFAGGHEVPEPQCVMVADTVDVEPSAPARDGAAYLTESDGARFDDLGEWWSESGDGAFVGFASAEDSSVWMTAECARAN